MFAGFGLPWMAAATTPPQNELERVVFSYAGWSAEMQGFHSALITAILEASQDKYGGYSLSFYDIDASPQRVRREVALGVNVQVDFSAMTLAPGKVSDNTVQLDVPLMFGVLGLRQLIVRKDVRDALLSVEKGEDFKEWVVGQGAHWQDNEYYRLANIEVVESIHFSNLFSMLQAGRFDYVALGVVEAETALAGSPQPNDLQIHEQVFVYYPLRVYANVSAERPELAQRLRYGVEKIERDGTLSQIFDAHFGEHLQRVRQRAERVFILPASACESTFNPDLIEADIERLLGPEVARVYLEPTRRCGDASRSSPRG